MKYYVCNHCPFHETWGIFFCGHCAWVKTKRIYCSRRINLQSDLSVTTHGLSLSDSVCMSTGNSKYHFNAHMNAHFEHACPQCDYTSRTEGRLKRHIKDFHSDTPPNNFSGSRMLSSSPSSFAPMKREPGRPKLFRCRHCDFSSTTKVCGCPTNSSSTDLFLFKSKSKRIEFSR